MIDIDSFARVLSSIMTREQDMVTSTYDSQVAEVERTRICMKEYGDLET